MTLEVFLLSVLSNLFAIALVYLLYVASTLYARSHVGRGECWWLPGANTFRFVIRNIPRKNNLFDIRYRGWLRKDIPARDNMSVTTFLDADLVQGKRLLLPGGQDLPMLSFRLEAADPMLNLVVTDKMGNALHSLPIDDDTCRVMVEFYVKARTWFLFKHEIARLYAIPHFREIQGQRRDVFREYLLPMESSGEQIMKSVLENAEEITVSI